MYYEILEKSFKDFMFKTFGHKKDIYQFLINHETFTKAVEWAAEQFEEVKKRNLDLTKETVQMVGNDFCRIWCLTVLNRKEVDLRQKMTAPADLEKDDNVIKTKFQEKLKEKMKTGNWDKLMANKDKKDHVKKYSIGSDIVREKEIEIIK